MGLRLLIGHEDGSDGPGSQRECLYDSTTETVFGPAMPEDVGQPFASWHFAYFGDPRHSKAAVQDRYHLFLDFLGWDGDNLTKLEEYGWDEHKLEFTNLPDEHPVNIPEGT